VAPSPRAARIWSPAWISRVLAQASAEVPGLASDYLTASTTHWHSWNRRDLVPAEVPELRHKVYVSPLPDELLRALPVVLRVVNELAVPGFKVGASTLGVLRPDKLVLYAGDAKAADAVAHRLAAELAGVAAQGVPFTGQVGPRATVSRGYDPQGTSWRAWVTGEVALALHAAAAQGEDRVAARALEALAGQGIDVHGWWPAVLAGVA
jgi:hypothetical protein